MPDNKKINVLHLTDRVNAGGGHKIILNQLNDSELEDKINYTFVIMAGVIDENLKEEISALNCKLYILPKNENKKRIITLFRLLKIIYKEKIDIIHTHGPSTKHWSMLCKIFINKLKLVYTVHWMDNFKPLNKILLFLHNLLVDASICISKAVEQNSLPYYIKNLVQIYNGIDIEHFRPKNTLPKYKDPNSFKIINVARIEHQIKGQDILLKALGECKKRNLHFKCDLVGGTYHHTDSKEYLEKLIKELNLDNEISFLDIRYDIPELLFESDLFVLASRHEGFGLVVVEAMAAGLPVIASNIEGPAEIIQSGENGLLFENENYLDLADKITDLYQNRDKMNYLAKNAYKDAAKFDISIMSQKYYELYKRLNK